MSSLSHWRVCSKLSPTLTFLANPIANYHHAKAPYNNVILQALIFTPPPQPPRILLLQRSGGTDPNAFSQFWQVPSGRPNHRDQTLLYALSRIILEQTGLELSHVATLSGTEFGPDDASQPWMRMLLMIEVAELASISTCKSQDPEDLALEEASEYEIINPSEKLQTVQVVVNKDLHRLHVWASEEDLKGFVKSGLYPVNETTQYQIMLEAFAFYRQDFTQLEHLRRTRERETSYHGIDF